MRKQISIFLTKTHLRPMVQLVRSCMKGLKRQAEPVNWQDLRRDEPICRDFGFQRGTPIDRHIESLLK